MSAALAAPKAEVSLGTPTGRSTTKQTLLPTHGLIVTGAQRTDRRLLIQIRQRQSFPRPAQDFHRALGKCGESLCKTFVLALEISVKVFAWPMFVCFASRGVEIVLAGG